jgi:hypothetical protein
MHMTLRRWAAIGLLTAGCSSELPDRSTESALPPPQITALSTNQVVVGETLEFLGHHFAEAADTLDGTGTRLVLAGQFTDTDGNTQPVQLNVPAVFSGTVELDGEVLDILSWSRVGPFANPFTQDARLGRFEGKVTPVRTGADGVTATGESRGMNLTVGPSVIIEQLEPIDADCGAPAVRGLPGLPYVISVRAVGLKATYYRYEISRANGQTVLVREHDHGRGNFVDRDRLGINEPLVFDALDDEVQSQVSAIRVFARDDDGNEVETALPFSIHRPMEVRYDGTFRLAERYAPVPVSGCIPGSINTSVTYEESRSEARQQTVSVSVSRNWSNSAGRSVSQSTRDGISQGESHAREFGVTEWEGESVSQSQGVSYNESAANSVGYESSDGESWSWDLSEGESEEAYQERMNSLFGEASAELTVGAKGEGSIPGFAKVSGSVSATGGVTAGARTSGTTGSSRRSSTEQGWSVSGERNESRSFGSTVAEGRSESVSGSFALSSNSSRTSRDEQAESNTRTWSLGSGISQSEVATTGNAEVIDETWLDSTETTTSQAFTASIPSNRVGVFYRQTTRFVRRAEVRSYDLCGLASHVGELQFNEWTWAPDLAIGDVCDGASPASNLPPANCFIEPCDQ